MIDEKHRAVWLLFGLFTTETIRIVSMYNVLYIYSNMTRDVFVHTGYSVHPWCIHCTDVVLNELQDVSKNVIHQFCCHACHVHSAKQHQG